MRNSFDSKFGFPIVNSQNIFTTLNKFGIKHWPATAPPVSLGEYQKRSLSEKELSEIERFAPKVEVTFLQNPQNEESFTGFRTKWNYGIGVHVFTLLPEDLVPVSAEFRHGAEIISLMLPGGVFDGNDKNPRSCAKREFEAETGLKLKKIITLETKDISGICISSRQSGQKSQGFLGVLPKPLELLKPELDPEEFLKIVLVPLKDWLELIEQGHAKDAMAICSTYMALRKLGRLKLVP